MRKSEKNFPVMQRITWFETIPENNFSVLWFFWCRYVSVPSGSENWKETRSLENTEFWMLSRENCALAWIFMLAGKLHSRPCELPAIRGLAVWLAWIVILAWNFQYQRDSQILSIFEPSRLTAKTLAEYDDLLRGPVAILFISRDTCSDSIAKLFRACFCGVSHNYRAFPCKMGYRTDVPVTVKLSTKGGYRTILGECEPPWKSIARYGESQR